MSFKTLFLVFSIFLTNISSIMTFNFNSNDTLTMECGDGMCYCSETTASCKDFGDKLRYIPRLPAGISKLYFQNNFLPNLTLNTFKNVSMTTVTLLSLTGNNISRISDSAFSGFQFLTTLCLDSNTQINITELSESFGSLQKTRSLSVNLNNISLTEISDGFFSNLYDSKLTSLHLDYNNIELLNLNSFQNVSSLQNLYMARNTIRSITKDVGHTKLRYINLSGNNLGRRMPKFCSSDGGRVLFPNLHALDLSENFISDLNNESINCLDKLSSLILSRNSLRVLNNNVFSRLTQLKKLQMASMSGSIKKIEMFAFNNSKLESLDLKENYIVLRPLAAFHLFLFCKNLQTLDISLNNFKKLNSSDILKMLSPLNRLKSLTAVRTRISNLPKDFLQIFPSLTTLNLDGNGIQNLVSIPSARVHRLQLLSLQGNAIRVLDRATSETTLYMVKKLNLANNPFSCTCEMLWFRSMISDSGQIGNMSLTVWPWRYDCATPSNLKGVLFVNFRPTEESCKRKLPIATICLASILFLASVVALLAYKYRWYIAYWYHKLKSRNPNPEKQPLLAARKQDYTAYVIYNIGDSKFVHNNFQQLIEQQYDYKLHIWERNATGGQSCFKEMLEGIQASKHVIAVISRNALDDTWIQFQLDVALDRQMELKREFLILVILEDFDFSKLNKYWCVMLTRLPNAYWCEDKSDVKRNVFEQKLLKHLKKVSVRSVL